MENILIQAKYQGPGAVWCGIFPDQVKINQLRELYHFQGYVQVLALLSMGYPACERPVKDRFKAEHVHVGAWQRVLEPRSSFLPPKFADKWAKPITDMTS